MQCRSINNGKIVEKTANMKPGKICHSRCLTTAIRILRLYVAKSNTSQGLILLTEFIVKVYAPMWFSIRQFPSVIYGPKHLFELLRLSQYLRIDLRNEIDKVIQRNSFFAHPENLLLAMIFDERITIRELAFRRILNVRKK